MARKRYQCVGVLPLSFADGPNGEQDSHLRQEVECGEQFERDFAATSAGEAQERFLLRLGYLKIMLPEHQEG